jgi:hypothetical protein
LPCMFLERQTMIGICSATSRMHIRL